MTWGNIWIRHEKYRFFIQVFYQEAVPNEYSQSRLLRLLTTIVQQHFEYMLQSALENAYIAYSHYNSDDEVYLQQVKDVIAANERLRART